MTYEFRPAITSEAKPLIGLYAESGAGKTFSSLLLAKGFAGDMGKVGMIETESGRGEVFADDPVIGGYRVLPIREDFSPTNYGKAISAAEKANLRVLILDSASHEWEGDGGVLAMAAANQKAGKKGPLVWQEPKIDHARHFVLRLLQTPIPLVIVNMRAKYPMVQVTPEYAKTHPGAKVGEWARDTDLSPKQSDDILFEMMVHGWIDKNHNLHVTKWTKDAFKTIFLDGKPITVETGTRLAEWAAGRVVTATTAAGNLLTPNERKALIEIARKTGHRDEDVASWLAWKYQCASTKDIRREDYQEIMARLGHEMPLGLEMAEAAEAERGE